VTTATARRLTITLDTNTLPLEQALRALGPVPADVKITSVTAREVGCSLTRRIPVVLPSKTRPE
jgi:hypothetical protein